MSALKFFAEMFCRLTVVYMSQWKGEFSGVDVAFSGDVKGWVEEVWARYRRACRGETEVPRPMWDGADEVNLSIGSGNNISASAFGVLLVATVNDSGVVSPVGSMSHQIIVKICDKDGKVDVGLAANLAKLHVFRGAKFGSSFLAPALAASIGPVGELYAAFDKAEREIRSSRPQAVS